MLKIRKAEQHNIAEVDAIYTEILRYEEEHTKYTVFELGVYPTRQTAEKAFAENSLFVLEQHGQVYASIIVNQMQPAEYQEVHWNCDAAPEEVMVIHLLCVSPTRAGQGLWTAMVKFVETLAKERNCKVVRLDTGAQNIPAVSLYQKLGFKIADTATMAIGGIISHKNHLFLELTLG